MLKTVNLKSRFLPLLITFLIILIALIFNFNANLVGTNTDQGKFKTIQAQGYRAYDDKEIKFAEKGKVILFFHAAWCSTCKVLEKDILQNINNIPVDVKILDVDYDKYTILREKYGVTIQHTLVQIDKDANLIRKWSLSMNLAELLKNIQK